MEERYGKERQRQNGFARIHYIPTFLSDIQSQRVPGWKD
jgi:hypothetical protein